MNALIRKEVRLLLPSFAAALLLSLGVWLMPTRSELVSEWRTFVTVFPFLLCPAMVVMMALDSFGREISGSTLSHLLAQPIPRATIWRTKVLLLAGALLVVLTVWAVSFQLHFQDKLAVPELGELKDWFLLTPALFALVAFTGGLWTVLLLRQVTAAFWSTLIAPAAILLLVMNVTEQHPALFRVTLIPALILYSAAGFFFARRLFLRAQDLQPGGGEIALPRWRAWNWRFASAGEKRRWRPRAALWRKELQLHQSQFVLAGVLLLLHLGVLATRPLVNETGSPALHFVLHAFWVLWLFMALLIGCAAVAEERKLGTLEGQLCLPATRRWQFLLKFLSALLLSVAFGAVVPVLLEGKRILPNFDHQFEEFAVNYANGYYHPIERELAEFLRVTLPFLTLAGIATLIGTMAFYASTLARNTLQSLAPAVLGLLAVLLAWKAAANTDELFGVALWRGPLAHLLGVPVFAMVFAALMYWNFKRVLIGWPVWRRNVLVLVGALAFVTTASAALYHRAWEYLGPLEPAHGPPVLAISPRVNLRLEGWRPMVELPDGRRWTSYSGYWEGRGMITPRGGGFLDGTNWVKVAATHRDLIGLRTDGSLWVSAEPEPFPATLRSPLASTRMVRVGTENDWTDLVTHQFQTATMLKADGTLWELGTNRWSTNQPYPGLRAYTPKRLGVDSDWTSLSVQGGRIILHQRDGQFWVAPKYSTVDTNTRVLHGGLTLYRAPDLNLDQPLAFHAAWRRGSAQVGVLSDGTFRVVGGWGQVAGTKKFGPQKRDVLIGMETNWLAVAGSYNNIAVTLRADGTLWQWEFPDDPALHPETARATQLGTHSDWIAVGTGWGGMFALARDGSLWLWRLPRVQEDRSIFSLLGTSRRPERMGNIFETPLR